MNKCSIKIDLRVMKCFLYFFLLFPYPLIERAYPVMDNVLKIVQVFVLLLCICEAFFKKTILYTRTTIGIFVFLVWSAISSMIMSSRDLLSFARETAFPILASLFLAIVVYENECNAFFSYVAKFYYFSIWLNFIIMLRFPKGVVMSRVGATIERSNWLFGSKNNYYTIIPLVFFFILADLYNKQSKRHMLFTIITYIIFLFCIASSGSFGAEFMAGSATSIIICLLYMVVYVIEMTSEGIIKRFINFRTATLLSLFLMTVVVLVGLKRIGVLDTLFLIFGKDSSFSGRSNVWMEGLQAFSGSPVVGIGSKRQIFHLFGLSSSNNLGLYSFWITVLVRYGIIGFLILFHTFYSVNKNIGGKIFDLVAITFFVCMISHLVQPPDWKSIIFIIMTAEYLEYHERANHINDTEEIIYDQYNV